jgi:hypothetical protein
MTHVVPGACGVNPEAWSVDESGTSRSKHGTYCHELGARPSDQVQQLLTFQLFAGSLTSDGVPARREGVEYEYGAESEKLDSEMWRNLKQTHHDQFVNETKGER